MPLEGILCALASPFDRDESLNLGVLRSLVDRCVDGGVHGLVACGSMGEFTQLSMAERKTVAETVIEQAGGRVPTVVHTGAMRTREAIDLSQHAEAAGAAAVMVLAPYYEPLELDEIKAYYKAIAASITIPVIIYNLPFATGVNLRPEDVAAIAHDAPNVTYIKDSSGDFKQANQLIHEQSGVINTLIGWDTFFLTAFAEGAVGTIVGSANIIAPQLVSIYNAVKRDDLKAAKSEWDEIYPLMQFLVSGAYTPATKAALEIIGLEVGAPREPVAPLAGDRREQLRGILADLGLV